MNESAAADRQVIELSEETAAQSALRELHLAPEGLRFQRLRSLSHPRNRAGLLEVLDQLVADGFITENQSVYAID